jgi:hypothetical protein
MLVKGLSVKKARGSTCYGTLSSPPLGIATQLGRDMDRDLGDRKIVPEGCTGKRVARVSSDKN